MVAARHCRSNYLRAILAVPRTIAWRIPSVVWKPERICHSKSQSSIRNKDRFVLSGRRLITSSNFVDARREDRLASRL